MATGMRRDLGDLGDGRKLNKCQLYDNLAATQNSVLPPDLQRPFVCKEELPPEQQEWNPSLGQGPHPPHIKEEELDRSIQEAGITKLPFPPVCVKSESDEERAQWSQLNQSQTEENRVAEPLATSTQQTKTEVGGQDFEISVAAGHSDPSSVLEPTYDEKLLSSHSSEMNTEVSDEDWKETREPQSGVKYKFAQTLGFSSNEDSIHEPIYTGDGPYHCQQCGRGFRKSGYLKKHLHIHTGDRPYKCQQCGKEFSRSGNLKRHQLSHARDKPFHCQQCGIGFKVSDYLKKHLLVHILDRPYKCQCGKGFRRAGNLKDHQLIHTGKKPYKCQVWERIHSTRIT